MQESSGLQPYWFGEITNCEVTTVLRVLAVNYSFTHFAKHWE